MPGTALIASSRLAISARSFNRTERAYETYFPPEEARPTAKGSVRSNDAKSPFAVSSSRDAASTMMR